METIAYGLFGDRSAADAAVDLLGQHGYPKEVVSVAEHVGEIEDEDVQGIGTRSRSYALIGGVIAAVVGGVLGAILFGERMGAGPVVTGAVAALAAGILGALVASLAGAAIPRPEVEALGREVAAGKVLVTVDVQSKHAGEELQGKLAELGALQAGLLSGTGAPAMLRARVPGRFRTASPRPSTAQREKAMAKTIGKQDNPESLP
jgi:hypothetical protein